MNPQFIDRTRLPSTYDILGDNLPTEETEN
jgi:hypothetical protein